MNSIRESVRVIAEEHARVAAKSFEPAQLTALEKISAVIIDAFRNKKKILLCGNGGSAADSQHIAAEFIVRFKRERRSLPAIALTTDTSIITATGNDYNYESIFSRQVEGLGEAGDVLIAISTSGNSPNVIAAVLAAKKNGMAAVGFTGASGGKLIQHTDVHFQAASSKTPHIQEMHITALHAVSEVVEDQLFS